MGTSTSQSADFFSSSENDPPIVPRFCPHCLRSAEFDPHVTLCKTCGDPLVPRGYCPICESYVNQPVGAPCAKHDIPLEDWEAEHRDSEYRARNWMTIQTYPDRSAAEGLRIRLESEGIPTFLDGERMGSAAMYQVATGGVKLQVPEEALDEARIIASQLWSPPPADPDDLDDAWDELAPSPGMCFRSMMETLSLVFVAANILIVLGVVLFALIGWLSG